MMRYQQEDTKLYVSHIGYHKSQVGAVRAALVPKLGTARQNANIPYMDTYHIYGPGVTANYNDSDLPQEQVQQHIYHSIQTRDTRRENQAHS